ncbi:hypothetical protein GM655_15990 [Pseudoduganella danionis]|uniref:GPI inositol-deacylase PGAP1-like alpha/beta domain-containing protein n=2 Tax=Pseudoduganella danionis TaxID=1890295 RepID=A0ABW9SRS9_9BURK|nr:hypothetical protein [Pseudoduganella danionis]MTW34309.1 hypothetical protein [Pseudoduganella danionis]
MADGQHLPIDPFNARKCASGFCTPLADQRTQVVHIPPTEVIPIIFIPGIMGSNLRMSAKRQALLNKNNNIAWRVDSTYETARFIKLTAGERQKQLDPSETCVDTYDEGHSETGNPSETPLKRNSGVTLKNVFQQHIPNNFGVLLAPDPSGSKRRKTHLEKALERGWGEILFDSYGELLQLLERHLNEPMCSESELSEWWKNTLVQISPTSWGNVLPPDLSQLKDTDIIAALSKRWFPTHAMGYNWLESNSISGIKLSERISALISKYNNTVYKCEKVILITHSMGGLAARAAMHPAIGKIEKSVHGVIHGAMPALGAGTAYKRMRCGFEGYSLSIVRNVLGATGAEVTSVLANAPGGLELLPSKAYGNGWLQVIHENQLILNLPQNGDPYSEIYKLKDKWFRLLKEEWINPARLNKRNIDRSFALLDEAKTFHEKLNEYFHPNSYAIYGADRKKTAWGKVTWQLDFEVTPKENLDLCVSIDNGIGEIYFTHELALKKLSTDLGPFKANLATAQDPGDETVAICSSDSQMKFCKAVFRQTGYEHQESFKDEKSIAATFYSLIKIIQSIKR